MESWPKFIILIFAQYTFHFYQIFKKLGTARIKETMKEYNFILMGQSNIQLTLCRHFLTVKIFTALQRNNLITLFCTIVFHTSRSLFECRPPRNHRMTRICWVFEKFVLHFIQGQLNCCYTKMIFQYVHVVLSEAFLQNIVPSAEDLGALKNGRRINHTINICCA